MELVEGGTLEELLAKSGALPVARALGIARRVALALHAVHLCDVVHRDIKPSNVMLTVGPPPGVKLLDFGVSKLTGPVAHAEETRVTRSCAVVGTPAYMAPEQALGSPSAGPAADIYSLGVLLYEAFTNMMPFADIAERHFGVPVHISRLRPELPPGLARVVMRCLEREATERPDAATLAVQLGEFEQIDTEVPSGPRSIDVFSSTVSGDAATGEAAMRTA
jgi:serine/threonine protein kinase